MITPQRFCQTDTCVVLCRECRTVPARPAVLQAQSCNTRHEIHLGRPGVPERNAPEPPFPVCRHGDVVRRELLGNSRPLPASSGRRQRFGPRGSQGDKQASARRASLHAPLNSLQKSRTHVTSCRLPLGGAGLIGPDSHTVTIARPRASLTASLLPRGTDTSAPCLPLLAVISARWR